MSITVLEKPLTGEEYKVVRTAWTASGRPGRIPCNLCGSNEPHDEYSCMADSIVDALKAAHEVSVQRVYAMRDAQILARQHAEPPFLIEF